MKPNIGCTRVAAKCFSFAVPGFAVAGFLAIARFRRRSRILVVRLLRSTLCKHSTRRVGRW